MLIKFKQQICCFNCEMALKAFAYNNDTIVPLVEYGVQKS